MENIESIENINFISENKSYIFKSHLAPLEGPLEKNLDLIQMTGPFWVLASSGSTRSEPRWVVIKKENFLRSAQSVVNFFNLGEQDHWARVLPIYHVSGLSICARAYLQKARVYFYDKKWNPEEFYHWIKVKKITCLSLVPTQIYDLVQAGLNPPSSLRYVFVGGASLDSNVKQQAFNLNWPLIMTFGMTETSAFFSSQRLGKKGYYPLPGAKISQNEEGYLTLNSPGLFEGYFEKNQESKWFYSQETQPHQLWTTSDKIEIHGDGSFDIEGRGEDYIKINGEGICLPDLMKRFVQLNSELIVNHDFVIVAIDHQRKGFHLVIVCDPSAHKTIQAVESWNRQVLGLERLELVFLPKQIWPLSDLGKVQMLKMKDLVRVHLTRGLT